MKLPDKLRKDIQEDAMQDLLRTTRDALARCDILQVKVDMDRSVEDRLWFLRWNVSEAVKGR